MNCVVDCLTFLCSGAGSHHLIVFHGFLAGRLDGLNTVPLVVGAITSRSIGRGILLHLPLAGLMQEMDAILSLVASVLFLLDGISQGVSDLLPTTDTIQFTKDAFAVLLQKATTLLVDASLNVVGDLSLLGSVLGGAVARETDLDDGAEFAVSLCDNNNNKCQTFGSRK